MASDDRTHGIPANVLAEHAGFVRSLARAILSSDADADDAAQEALTTALASGPDNPAAHRSWLAAVVRNAAHGLRRRQARRTAREREAVRSVAVSSSLDAAVKAETIQRVGLAVAQLAEPERTAVLLRHYDNLPPRVIAERLGVPVATVKSRLLRAHERLRARLDEGGPRERDQRRRALAAFAGISLAGPLSAATAAGTAVTGVIMGLTTKSVVVAAAALVVLGVGVYVVLPGDAPAPSPAPSEVTSASDAGPVVESPQLKGSPKPASALVSGSTISGLVRRDGIPVVARVELRPSKSRNIGIAAYSAESLSKWLEGPRPPPPPFATAVSGSDGRFSVTVTASGYVEALAVASDGALGFAFVEVPAAGARVETKIDVLDGSHALHGRISTTDGRPWIGMVAALGDRITSQYRHRPAVATDTEGRFVVDGLPTGTASVTAFRAGELVVTRRGVTVPHAGEYVFVIDEGLSTLTGRVVDEADGQPIGGATVVVLAGTSGDGTSRFRTLTGADGAFSVSWGTKNDNAWFVAEGYVPINLYSRGLQNGMEVRLAKEATVTGRVVRASDGRSVPGARVRALSLADGQWTSLLAETIAAPDGTYELGGLPPGDVAIVGLAPGLRSPVPTEPWHGDWSPMVTSLTPHTRVAHDVKLVGAAAIAGRVLDGDGAPVAGATIRVDPTNGGHEPFAIDVFAHVDAPQTSGADGEFLVDGLPSGVSWTFIAEGPPPAQATVGPVTLTDGPPTRLEFRLPAARRLDVLVLDAATGLPIGGASVRAEVPSSRALDVVTDASGHAVVKGLELTAPITLEIRAVRFASTRRAAPLPGIDSTAFRLEAGRELTGKALRPDGSAAAGAAVWVSIADGSVPRAYVATGADGTFRVPDLPKREFVVQAFSGDGASPPTTGTVGADVVLRIAASVADSNSVVGGATDKPGGNRADEPVGLVVRVVDAAGHPVPRAQAQLVRPSGTTGTNVSGGRVVIDRPEPEAAIEVRVWGARSSYGVPLPFGPARVPISPGAREIDVRLGPEVSVDGLVLGPDGHGMSGVLVIASWPQAERDLRSNPYPWNALGAARTDDAGRFRVGGLAVEDVVLFVVAPAGTAPVPGVATRGGAHDLEFRLRPGVAPRLRVLDPEGKALDRAQVSVDDLEHRVRSGQGMPRWTDSRGDYVCDPVDPTFSYRLTVTAQSRGDLARYVVPRWTPKDETIHMPRACVLRGVVVDTAGRPIPEAFVQRIVGEGDNPGSYENPMQGAHADEAGRFVIREVPEGPVKLRPSIIQGLARSETTVNAAVNGEDVTLTLDLGLELRVRIDGWAKATDARGQRAYLFEGAPAKGVVFGMYPVDSDGTITFLGLRRDLAYTMWIPPTGGDWYVLREGVRWSTGETTVVRTRGLSIEGRLTAPPKIAQLQVWARRGGLNVVGRVETDGRFLIRGLPPGEWTVLGTGKDGHKDWRGEATASTGGSVEFELKEEEIR